MCYADDVTDAGAGVGAGAGTVAIAAVAVAVADSEYVSLYRVLTDRTVL